MNEVTTNKLDGAALISAAAAKHYKTRKNPGDPPKLRKKLLSFANQANPSTKEIIEAGSIVAQMIDWRRDKFKKACNKISARQLGFDIFDDQDSYEVDHLHWIGADPGRFVREHFAEDYDRLSNQQLEREEADNGG